MNINVFLLKIDIVRGVTGILLIGTAVGFLLLIIKLWKDVITGIAKDIKKKFASNKRKKRLNRKNTEELRDSVVIGYFDEQVETGRFHEEFGVVELPEDENLKFPYFVVMSYCNSGRASRYEFGVNSLDDEHIIEKFKKCLEACKYNECKRDKQIFHVKNIGIGKPGETTFYDPFCKWSLDILDGAVLHNNFNLTVYERKTFLPVKKFTVSEFLDYDYEYFNVPGDRLKSAYDKFMESLNPKKTEAH